MEQRKASYSEEPLPFNTFNLPIYSSSASNLAVDIASDDSKSATSDEIKVAPTVEGIKTFSSSSSLRSSRSLVEILLEINSFPEFLAKSVFKGILKEIEKLYSQNRYHGNLSLQSVYMTCDHEIVLADPVTEKESFVEGALADMFRLGEILFSLVAGFLPFTSESDPNFVAVIDENWEAFWSSHEATLARPNISRNFFRSELRTLIADLLSMRLDPELMVAQLSGHPWLQGAEISLKHGGELLNEIRKKMNKINY